MITRDIFPSCRSFGTWSVLDGELCAFDVDGRPIFEKVLLRDVRRAFVVFDVLRIGKEEVKDLPLEERQKFLADCFRRTTRT